MYANFLSTLNFILLDKIITYYITILFKILQLFNLKRTERNSLLFDFCWPLQGNKFSYFLMMTQSKMVT